jgi:chaperonin GroES
MPERFWVALEWNTFEYIRVLLAPGALLRILCVVGLALPHLECQQPFQNNQSEVKTRQQTMASIKPLGDRVVVRPQPAEEKTASGLFIPDTAKEKPQRGTVLAVGPGKVENGTKVDMTVSEGDIVLYGKYSGTEIAMDNEDVLIMRESDILGIVND